jgi:diacylglycerol kinase family enzyme
MAEQLAGEKSATPLQRKAVLALINPHAGSGEHASLQRLLTEVFARQGRTIVLRELRQADSVAEVALILKEAFGEGTRLVIAAGGDGTASHVAQALLHAGLAGDMVLGLFPSGTANTLAMELGMPAHWTQAAERLAQGSTTVPLDAMRIGDRFAFLRIGIGLDAETIRQTAGEAKRRFGRWAYLRSFLRRLPMRQRHRFRCVIDGKKHKFFAVQVFIANGGSIALAPFRLGPDIELGDGKVNVCAYDALTRWDYGKLLWRLLRGDFRRQPQMKFWFARHTVIVKTHQPLRVQADGEPLGQTPLNIRILPGAVRVLAALPSPAQE